MSQQNDPKLSARPSALADRQAPDTTNLNQGILNRTRSANTDTAKDPKLQTPSLSGAAKESMRSVVDKTLNNKKKAKQSKRGTTLTAPKKISLHPMVLLELVAHLIERLQQWLLGFLETKAPAPMQSLKKRVVRKKKNGLLGTIEIEEYIDARVTTEEPTTELTHLATPEADEPCLDVKFEDESTKKS